MEHVARMASCRTLHCINFHVCLQDVMREDIYCHSLRKAVWLIMLIADSFLHFPFTFPFSPLCHYTVLCLAVVTAQPLPREEHLAGYPFLFSFFLFLCWLSSFTHLLPLKKELCHSISHLLSTFYLFLLLIISSSLSPSVSLTTLHSASCTITQSLISWAAGMSEGPDTRHWPMIRRAGAERKERGKQGGSTAPLAKAL